MKIVTVETTVTVSAAAPLAGSGKALVTSADASSEMLDGAGASVVTEEAAGSTEVEGGIASDTDAVMISVTEDDSNCLRPKRRPRKVLGIDEAMGAAEADTVLSSSHVVSSSDSEPVSACASPKIPPVAPVAWILAKASAFVSQAVEIPGELTSGRA